MAAPTISGNQFNFVYTGNAAMVVTIPFWGNFTTDLPDMSVIVGVAVLANDNVPPSISGISDTLGLTWVRIGSVSQTGLTSVITGAPVAETIEFWKAYAAGTPSWAGHVITVTPSSNADCAFVYTFRIKDCNIAQPLDLNVDWPASGVRRGSSAALSLTGLDTDTSNICVVAMRCSAGFGNNVNSGGFTIDGVSGDFGQADDVQGTNHLYAGTLGKQLTAALASSTLASASVIENTAMLALVFTADTQSAPAVTTAFGVVIS